MATWSTFFLSDRSWLDDQLGRKQGKSSATVGPVETECVPSAEEAPAP